DPHAAHVRALVVHGAVDQGARDIGEEQPKHTRAGAKLSRLKAAAREAQLATMERTQIFEGPARSPAALTGEGRAIDLRVSHHSTLRGQRTPRDRRGG